MELIGLVVMLACVFQVTSGEESPVLIVTRPFNKTAFPGEVVVLPCSVTPNADITVQWYKDGKNITQSNRVKVGVVSKRLYIFDTSDSDTGWYTCVARNQKGSDTAKAFLKIIGDGPPFITSIPKNVTLHVSQEYYLTCEGKGVPAPQYTWLYEGQSIVDNSILQTKGVLHLSYAELRHSGKYTCMVWNDYGSANVSAYVAVLNDPTMTESPKNTLAYLGKPAKLECFLAASWADVQKMWTKQNMKVIENRRVQSNLINQNTRTVLSLEFKEVRLVDEGSYRCAFSNRNGMTVSDPAYVRVVDPPIVHAEFSEVKTQKSHKGTIVCSASGRPLPEIKWFLKGQQVTSSSSVTIQMFSNKTTTTSVLEIINTEVKDEGMLTCRAVNIVGTSDRNISYLVIGGPEPPWNVVANMTSERVVAVSWNEGHQGGDEPYFIVQYRHKDDHDGEWEQETVDKGQHITYLTGEKDWGKYHIRVVAVNKHSKSSPSEAVQVQDHNRYATAGQETPNIQGNTLLIILVIIGVGFLVLIVSITVVVYMRHNKSHLKPTLGVTSATYTVGSGNGPEVKISTGGSKENMISGESSSKENLDQDIQDGYTTVPAGKNWEIPRKSLVLEKTIGAGNFGKVVKATFIDNKGEKKQVAVKMMKVGYTNKDLKDFMKELDLMKSIEPHPHVVCLVGCCTKADNPYIVVEYLPNGNLLDFLQANHAKEYDLYTNLAPFCKNLSSKDLLSFAWQISKGMSYLSNLRLVHRDLAARNILLTGDNQCKIADFGLARDIYQDNLYLRTTMGHLPLRWMAYEAVFQGVSTVETDVWSFGIVLWEIVTLGAIPYPDMGRDQLLAALTQGYRMPKPSHCSDEIYDVMSDCWHEDPKHRPTFSQLTRTLHELMSMNETMIDLKSLDNDIYVNTAHLQAQEHEKTKVDTEVKLAITDQAPLNNV